MVVTPVILATWEVEVGGSQSEAGLDKSTKSYLKMKPESKKTRMWLRW
jgi:hypothetical protein